MRHSNRLLAAALAGEKVEVLKRSSTAQIVAPILVNCAGSSSSDELDQGDRYAEQGEADSRRYNESSCYSDASTPSQPFAAERISQADLQKGNYRTGVRYCIETWPQNALYRALDTILAMSSMFGYTSTPLLLPSLVLAAWYLPWTIPSWGLGIFAWTLLLSVFLPAEPLLWEWFQHSTLVSSWRRYFQFSVAIEHKLDPTGKYIFAGFPHGVFPVSELLCISLMLRIWPTLRIYSIAASSVFKMPVWRHILCWTGARPATRRWFTTLLSMGSVSLVPGGIAEMFLWEEHREVIKILDRKGFVRIAVEQGVPLVPVYHFGNSRLFSWVAPRSWEILARRTRAAFGYPKGRGALCYHAVSLCSWLLVPRSPCPRSLQVTPATKTPLIKPTQRLSKLWLICIPSTRDTMVGRTENLLSHKRCLVVSLLGGDLRSV